MQVLNKLLTRLFLEIPQNEANDEFAFEVDLAGQIATKLIAKVSDLYCCTHSVAILLECFVYGGSNSAILKQQLFTQTFVEDLLKGISTPNLNLPSYN